MRLTLDVNGIPREVEVSEHTSLLAVLRDDCNLTGTRYGCGFGVCGACFVLMDGQAVASCTLEAADAVGKHIVTIEGLAHAGTLTAVQQAFLDADAMQCGYCTSGMIVSATALLKRNPHPDEAQIREALDPHLCRCGVYLRAISAVASLAR